MGLAAKHRRACDLNDGSYHVRSDEYPEDWLPLQPDAISRLVRISLKELGQADVNAGRDQDGCDDNKEVLYHEIDNVVGITVTGQIAGGVADGFH